MTLAITHKKTLTIPDDPAAEAAGLVLPSNWNDTLNAVMASGYLLGRSTVGDGPVQELDAAAARALLGIILGASAGNVPVLDGSGKLATSVLPALALTDTFEVASQSAMLALSAQQGDIAIRTDLNKTFVLASNSPSTLSDWKELRTPTDVVLSVAGLSGAITAAALRTALGLVVGTNVQAHDAELAAIAALDPVANDGKFLKFSGGSIVAASAGGASSMNKDPRLLPVIDSSNYITMRAIISTGAEQSLLGADPAFWNEFAKMGAVNTTISANTWSTIVNISGFGALFHVLAPMLASTSQTVDFRITVDGQATTISRNSFRAANNVNGRVLLGSTERTISGGASYSAQYGMTTGYSNAGANLNIFNNAGQFGAFPGEPVLYSPLNILQQNMPSVFFESSLKVEVRVSAVPSSTTVPNLYHGCSYMLMG